MNSDPLIQNSEYRPVNHLFHPSPPLPVLILGEMHRFLDNDATSGMNACPLINRSN